MATVYVEIRGLHFGSMVDKPSSRYSFSIYNPETGNKSKFYRFIYTPKVSVRLGFSMAFTSHRTQYFTIMIHKQVPILNKKELVGKVDVPLSAFPLNLLCPEKLQVMTEKPQIHPMSISFAVHLDTRKAKPLSAPLGESKLPKYDSNNYFDVYNTLLENNTIESPLI